MWTSRYNRNIEGSRLLSKYNKLKYLTDMKKCKVCGSTTGHQFTKEEVKSCSKILQHMSQGPIWDWSKKVTKEVIGQFRKENN